MSPPDPSGQAPLPTPETFLSGQSGYVAGLRATARALATDLLADGVALASRARATAAGPPRRVLVLAVEHESSPNLLAAALAELATSRHRLTVATTPTGQLGKFENLNRLLAAHAPESYDWLLVLDDDVALPHRFLDSFLHLAERFGFVLAQPAHRALSHAAWPHTRRRIGSIARRTAHVEIGPVTAFQRASFAELLPFPPLRYGWGLDLHWSALAARHRWPIGVIDATPIAHRLRPVASTYPRAAAITEAQHFLRDRAYLPAGEAARTLEVHRR